MPSTGDPREVCTRQLSKQVVWLCRNKPRTAKEISEELHLPMIYAEEELEIQAHGKNGTYGLLKKLPDEKYIVNFVLLDDKKMEELWQVYIKRIPFICEKVIAYVEKHNGYRMEPDTKTWGGGFDQSHGENVCGYSKVIAENIYVKRFKSIFTAVRKQCWMRNCSWQSRRWKDWI